MPSSDILSADFLENIPAIKNEFQTAKPFRHAVIDNFFSDAFCEKVLADFPAFDDEKAKNEFGQVGNKAVHENVRDLGPTFCAIDDYIKSREFLDMIGEIAGIDNLLYDPEYSGGGTHENRSGQALDPHVDFNYQSTFGWHRRLNLIVYLNPDWDESWGGTIDLHSNPWSKNGDDVKSVLPIVNRAVMFETNDHSWHGFKAITPDPNGKKRSRRSFAIYLYSENRPQEEVFPPHGTFYVHRHLPEHLKPGHTLTERDVQEMNIAVEQRSQWIKYLYERELDYSGQVEGLKYLLAQEKAGKSAPPAQTQEDEIAEASEASIPNDTQMQYNRPGLLTRLYHALRS